MQPDELKPWLKDIDAGRADFQRKIGPAKLKLLNAAAQVLSMPRQVGGYRDNADTTLQRPWLPCWPALTAKPLHDPSDFPWIRTLEDASSDILGELMRVRGTFARARYDSDRNEKEWKTYYFYLQGKPIEEHLAACPVTRSVLTKVPHNGLHVCFSAIQPGGSLIPHTGPTNISLTAHLGLANCAGSRLWVANQVQEYIDNKVFVFDDTFVHYVENTGSEVRYTLMVTVWHPELSVAERMLLGRLASAVN